MAVYVTWQCTSCSHEVKTSGSHEFYRDGHGNRKPYGHPIPISFEASVYGVKGYSALKYCITCDQVRDVILTELETPNDHHRINFRNLPKTTFNSMCEECGGELSNSLDGVKCPRCNDGYFKKLISFWT